MFDKYYIRSDSSQPEKKAWKVFAVYISLPRETTDAGSRLSLSEPLGCSLGPCFHSWLLAARKGGGGRRQER